ncbi:MAG: IS200/IS605 family transposase [Ignavibacteriae bacterium]|nr:IS200/IS605 family transposase [Ignavibacteriota bacterium]
MANTFTQLYVHIVFSVKGRKNALQTENKESLHKYITAIVQKRNVKMMAINSMPDHIHIFLGLCPDISVSDIVRDIKHSSTNFINNKRWANGIFYWQEGYGAFTYSQSQINNVVKYIINQEIHHHKKTFREEYIELLKLFNIQYDEKYLFDI